MSEPDLRTAIALIYEQNARGDDLCRITLNMAVSIINQAIEERDKLMAVARAAKEWRAFVEKHPYGSTWDDDLVAAVDALGDEP